MKTMLHYLFFALCINLFNLTFIQLAFSNSFAGQVNELKAMESVIDTTIEDYELRKSFPNHSYPFKSDASDPVLTRFNNSVHQIKSEEDPTVRISVWSDQSFFQFPEAVTLFAQIESDRHSSKVEKQWFQRNLKIIEADVISPQGELIQTIRFKDKGKRKDVMKNDGIYTAHFRIQKDQVPEVGGTFLVKLKAQTAEDRWVQGSTGFLYSKPGIRLTGRFRSEQNGQDLDVMTQVRVLKSGTYHLAGSIYQANRPIGYAQNKLVLDQGIHWVPLSYFGTLFDGNTLGKMTQGDALILKNLRVTDVSKMPNGPLKLKRDQFTIRNLDKNKLRRGKFVNTQMERNIKKLHRTKQRLMERRKALENQIELPVAKEL